MEAVVEGPENTPYEGGFFFFRVDYPENYPWSPPRFTLLTKIWHPGVIENGQAHPLSCYCYESFTYNWSPAFTATKFLLEF